MFEPGTALYLSDQSDCEHDLKFSSDSEVLLNYLQAYRSALGVSQAWSCKMQDIIPSQRSCRDEFEDNDDKQILIKFPKS
ncbi:uncharacterized [Tachysurus ichikawai]